MAGWGWSGVRVFGLLGCCWRHFWLLGCCWWLGCCCCLKAALALVCPHCAAWQDGDREPLSLETKRKKEGRDRRHRRNLDRLIV